LLASTSAGAQVPESPDKLVFPELEFTPPERASYRHTLPSGTIVYVVEDHDLPLVDVSVTVRTGSYLEPQSKAGLAYFTGTQLRKGGTETLTPEAFDEDLAFLAADMSASVSDTEGSASMNCLTKDLDRVLELFFNMLRTPRFDPRRLELEKSQKIQDLARRNDRTSTIESREWVRLLRGAKFFSVDHVTEKSLKSITREDLAAFHRRYFHPAQFIFAVSGDVDTGDILQRLEKALANWPKPVSSNAVPPVPKPEYLPVPGVYVVDKPSVNQGRANIGHLSTTRDNPDYYALSLMNQILGGGGFTSRITSRVRSDEGLAYSAGSRYQFGIYYEGAFKAYFQSKSESVDKAASIVLEVLEKMRAEKVSQKELDTAINYAVGVFPRHFASKRAIATTFADDEYSGRPADYWKNYRDKMKAVTVDDVLRVSKEYLRPDRLVVLIVGNAADILAGDASAGGGFLEKLAGEKGIQRIPLPDPLTLEYPEG
jgi:predicted Zn-dependent peptidase